MTQFTFGAGTLMAKRIDIANQPVAFMGTLQEWSIDFDQELVTLMGQNKVAADVAPGELKITGKAKAARIQAANFSNVFFGSTGTLSAGATSGFDMATAENHSSIAATTFTVSNGAQFLEDLGVFYHATGIALIPVTATPTVGQYIAGAVGVGTYTINTTDENVTGGLDVYYTYTVTNLWEIDLNNTLMGTGAIFEIVASVPYTPNNQGLKKLNIKLNACRSSKLPMAFKNKAYFIPEFDFTAFADASGAIGKIALSE